MRKSQIILCIRLNGIVEDFLENNDYNFCSGLQFVMFDYCSFDLYAGP